MNTDVITTMLDINLISIVACQHNKQSCEICENNKKCLKNEICITIIVSLVKSAVNAFNKIECIYNLIESINLLSITMITKQ